MKKTSTTYDTFIQQALTERPKISLPPSEAAFCRAPRLQIRTDTWPPLWIRAHSDQSSYHHFQSSSRAAYLPCLVPQLSVTLDSRHPRRVLGSRSLLILHLIPKQRAKAKGLPCRQLFSQTGLRALEHPSKQLRNFTTRSWRCTPTRQHGGLQFKTRNTWNQTLASPSDQLSYGCCTWPPPMQLGTYWSVAMLFVWHKKAHSEQIKSGTTDMIPMSDGWYRQALNKIRFFSLKSTGRN